jgi:hypothetical protein
VSLGRSRPATRNQPVILVPVSSPHPLTEKILNCLPRNSFHGWDPELSSGNSFHLLRQRVCDKLQIERPSVAKFNVGMQQLQMIEDFRNLNFRVRSAWRKYREGFF